MGELHIITTRAPLSSLPPKPRRRDIVLGLLLSRKGYWVSADEMIEALWGEDESGGPDWAPQRLKVFVHQLRGLGWNINTWSRCGYALIDSQQQHEPLLMPVRRKNCGIQRDGCGAFNIPRHHIACQRN
jgi:hypothetical protein